MSDQFLKFCHYLSGVSFASLPSHVVTQAKRVLVDTVGGIVAGSKSAEVSRFAAGIGGVAGQMSASCFGRREKYHPLHAALLNGMAGSTLEYEEGHALAMGHPAIQILPALLAVAETEDHSGDKLLASLIGGYEIACRISFGCRLREGTHPTGTWGLIGAALGVGLLKGRSPEELVQIADLASCSIGAGWVENAFSGYSASCLFAGNVNHSAIAANYQFEAGLRAAPGSLETTFSRFVSESFNWDSLAVGSDDSFVILGNYFKPYPTCRYTHPALDAVQKIMVEHTLDIHDIVEIKVYSFRAATHVPHEPTRSVEAVRFSVPHLIGILLKYGCVDLTTLKNEVLEDPMVLSLAGKVRLIFKQEFEEVRPNDNPARVEILSDGRWFIGEVRNARGGWYNPISDEEIAEKFLTLCEPVLGKAQTSQCLVTLNQIDKVDKVRTVTGLLRT